MQGSCPATLRRESTNPETGVGRSNGIHTGMKPQSDGDFVSLNNKQFINKNTFQQVKLSILYQLYFYSLQEVPGCILLQPVHHPSLRQPI